MSGISEERFTEHDLDCWYAAGRARGNGQVTATGSLMADLIAEIRSLRAENKELRASYERVERVLKESVEDRAREIAQEMVDQMYPPELVR